jgi:hypothetical protein
MPLWGNNDNATGNNKPKYANTTSTYGVSVTEASNTSGDGQKIAHAGWNKQTLGTGSVVSIDITDAGEGYSNGFLSITGGGGTGANASFVVNDDGNVTSVVVNSGGSGYTSAPTVNATGSNTAAATLTATVGGRAGRVHYETLVATGSITGDNTADNTYFPGT